ncbi:MAG: galactokinase [Firmicutes bacterium]|nr:galactokinase [Bacillota bacterium]
MNHQEISKKLKPAFGRLFGDTDGAAGYFAPGRANLIGEHIDYNGGCVLPCALTMGTWAVVRKRRDRMLRFYSLNFPGAGVIRSSLDDLRPLEDDSWSAYIKGVIWALKQRGFGIDWGLDLVLWGDLPGGAGLSSSASLEVLAGFCLKDIHGLPLTALDLAVIGQEAERDYVGVECGIMDQFASAAGRQGKAMLLDTASMDCRYVPLDLPEHALVITNTNVKHDLLDSPYNERRKQCQQALQLVRQFGDRPSLCSVKPQQLETMKAAFDDPIIWRRARHAVSENERVKLAAEALQKGDLKELGRLLNQSHRSLKEDFQVSCRELDILAETAQGLPDVLGSRMMGGGFGGCTISLVRREGLDGFRKTLGQIYREQTGIECTFYEVGPGGGPERIW